MLDKNALSQLSELKQQIQAQKEYAEGMVIATNGRFGFVRLEDGRDAFLNAEQMQRVLPNDRVKICLKQNAKGQWEGELEALVHCPLEEFVGQYQVNNKSHFVAPDIPHFKRWLFVPPNNRNIAQKLDYVRARLVKHPFKDGKAQVKVLEKICAQEEAYAERQYTIAKFGLKRTWNAKHHEQIEQLTDKQPERVNLSHIPFVTIDSEMTLDMDDALSITWDQDSQSWNLVVAIADPGSFIRADSPIAKNAQEVGQTAYLPGQALHMMPNKLAKERFSLVEQESKPALICQLSIATNGHVNNYEFFHGTIQSHHKLSYTQVNRYLTEEDKTAVPEDVQNLLEQLHRLAETRLQYREKHYLVIENQADYSLTLNERGRIEAITKVEKNCAHKLVEECMLACNICAGDFLSQHERGLFVTHGGLKEDRLGEAKALLKEELPEQNRQDLNQYDNHLQLIRTLQSKDEFQSILSPLKRMMQSSQISTTPQPHLSLGVPAYATITSPIRRYTDLYNHWVIQAILAGESPDNPQDDEIEKLQSALDNVKQGARDLDRWLFCHFIRDHIGEEAEGCIRIVTQQGFGVRLDNWGIDGFVYLGSENPKPKFDAKRMTLTLGENTYHLDQSVRIKIEQIDIEKRRINFCLVNLS